MYRLYGMNGSGNCYKAKLLLTQLQVPFEWVEVNTLRRETHTPEFLAMNSNGKVPVLEVEPGRYLPESNAILCYLAEGSGYLPAERWSRAQVLQWLFFEQYSHEPYIATARFIRHVLGRADDPSLPEKQARGYRALEVMEKHLSGQTYFASNSYSIADIALYAYTHVAHEGGFDLTSFPAISTWLTRVAHQPRHVPMS